MCGVGGVGGGRGLKMPQLALPARVLTVGTAHTPSGGGGLGLFLRVGEKKKKRKEKKKKGRGSPLALRV